MAVKPDSAEMNNTEMNKSSYPSTEMDNIKINQLSYP